MAVNMGEPGDQRAAVFRLELVELAAVDQTDDDIVHVIGNPRVDGNHVVELGLISNRLHRRQHIPDARFARPQCRHDAPDDAQRVAVVVGEMIGDTGDLGVQISAAEILGRYDFPSCRLHQRRTAEKDGALVANDHRLVTHRRNVGAACGA